MTFYFDDEPTTATIMDVDYEDLCILIAEEYVDCYDEFITDIEEIDDSLLQRIINQRISELEEEMEEEIDEELISSQKIYPLIIDRFKEREGERNEDD